MMSLRICLVALLLIIVEVSGNNAESLPTAAAPRQTQSHQMGHHTAFVGVAILGRPKFEASQQLGNAAKQMVPQIPDIPRFGGILLDNCCRWRTCADCQSHHGTEVSNIDGHVCDCHWHVATATHPAKCVDGIINDNSWLSGGDVAACRPDDIITGKPQEDCCKYRTCEDCQSNHGTQNSSLDNHVCDCHWHDATASHPAMCVDGVIDDNSWLDGGDIAACNRPTDIITDKPQVDDCCKYTTCFDCQSNHGTQVSSLDGHVCDCHWHMDNGVHSAFCYDGVLNDDSWLQGGNTSQCDDDKVREPDCCNFKTCEDCQSNHGTTFSSEDGHVCDCHWHAANDSHPAFCYDGVLEDDSWLDGGDLDSCKARSDSKSHTSSKGGFRR